jgi:cell filamentation protein
MSNRFDTSQSPGTQQPDSINQVLLNKLGIVDPQEMENVELILLDQLTGVVIESVTENQTITVSDLCEWHRRWLGNVYVWAGKYRLVNIGKGRFQFAAAHLIPKVMQALESKFLSIYTPCNRMDENQLVDALANMHIELILIHPFREGNGRLSRILANVMALQAGQQMLDFSYLDNNKTEYFAAVQAGLDNAEPMKTIFRQVLHETQQNAGG